MPGADDSGTRTPTGRTRRFSTCYGPYGIFGGTTAGEYLTTPYDTMSCPTRPPRQIRAMWGYLIPYFTSPRLSEAWKLWSQWRYAHSALVVVLILAVRFVPFRM